MKLAAISVVVIGAGIMAVINYDEHNVADHAAKISPANIDSHSADWYVAHPDVLHNDEKRCAGDAASLSPAACQNVASADARLYVIEMKTAAAANGAEGADKTKTSSR